MRKNLSLVLCCTLSAVVFHTCLQIEVWNYLAGGDVLPRPDGSKLRPWFGEDEQSWRRNNPDRTLAAGRPLTEEEQEAFREHSTYAKRHNKVVDWSRGMGLLQYLLAPVATVWSLVLMLTGKTRRARLVAALFSATNAISIVSMLYRGYFND